MIRNRFNYLKNEVFCWISVELQVLLDKFLKKKVLDYIKYYLYSSNQADEENFRSNYYPGGSIHWRN